MNTVIETTPNSVSILVDNKLWVWGLNLQHFLHDSIQFIKHPRQISKEKNFKFISASFFDAIAIDENGFLWKWGKETYENSEIKTSLNKKYYPFKIFETEKWIKVSIANEHNFCGIKNDSSLWIIGEDKCKLFKDYYNSSLTEIGKGQKWVDVSLGNLHGLALSSKTVLSTWGQNLFNQMGITDYINQGRSTKCIKFQTIENNNGWNNFDVCTTNSLALKRDKSLWFWGDTSYNSMAVSPQLLPKRNLLNFSWNKVSTSETHSFAIKDDGTLWAKGRNSYGQLGNGTTIENLKFTQIGNDSNWIDIKASLYYSIGVKSNGTIWTWGKNDNFQLGDGTTNESHIPQQIKLVEE